MKYPFHSLTGLSVTALLWGAIPPANAQTNYTALKAFAGTPDGATPMCELVEGTDGRLYGTTAAGGTNASPGGTVFAVNKDGSEAIILKSFSGPDGQTPLAGVIVGSDGMLYGTCYGGGVSNRGTVFRLAKDGSAFELLHEFLGGSDSKNPRAALVEGSNGVLYGTTDFDNTAVRGTIYRLDKDGSNYPVVHTFTGNPDGQQTPGRLLQASDGKLYGTTFFGGISIQGTVYRLNLDGSGYAVLYHFSNAGGNGANPTGGLIEGSDGLLYGMCYTGGTGSAGVIFRLNKNGTGYSVLHHFLGAPLDGERPIGALVENESGSLLGCTDYGGSASFNGAAFKINKDGSGYSVLRHFVSTGGGGTVPAGGFLRDSNNVFYGATQFGGGSGGGGCVFALSSNPFPPRALSLAVSNQMAIVQFKGTSATDYSVWRSTDLNSWSNLVTLTAPNSGRLTYTNSNPPQPAAFYRIALEE